MDDLTLLPADAVTLVTLTEAFNRAFEEYYISLVQTPQSLAALIESTDVSLAHSVAAVDSAGMPAGIGLLARREERGWIAGMGVAPEWRGHGQGARVLERVVARAREAGLTRVQLEVLDENAAARRLYARLGFTVLRPLRVYTGPLIRLASAPTRPSELAIGGLDPVDALAELAATRAVVPAWQRDLPSLLRMSGLRALALWPRDQPEAILAGVVYSPANFGVALLDAGSSANLAEARAEQVGYLLRAVVARHPRVLLRAINVPPGDPLGDALDALGCAVVSSQWEMALDLGRLDLGR